MLSSNGMWRIAEIADAVEQGLRHRFAQLDLEQAVYGLDILDELAVHPLLEHSLAQAGFGVHHEQRYPADRGKRSASEGERCDFVLTPDGRALKHPDAEHTLYDPPDAVHLADAFWLEVKVVSQFTAEGANPNYSSQFLSTVKQDVTKLSKDPHILHAGLLLILFVGDEQTSEHDLKIWEDRCVQRGLPIGAPARRCLPITNRHGHATCAIAVYPVSHL